MLFAETWSVDYNHKIHGQHKLIGMRKAHNDADVQSLKNNGITGIISMLDDTENHELYQANEMDFFWLPVKGGTAPNREQVEQANNYINQQLTNNPNSLVATHCNGGRKRTGTLLAGIMILNGEDPDSAIAKVETANPEITLSPTQRAFLLSLAQ